MQNKASAEDRLRLTTFNVDLFGRGRNAGAQIEALQRGSSPDLVALQEVTREALPAYRRELTRAGFAEALIFDTFSRDGAGAVGRRGEMVGQVIASRRPAEVLPAMREPALPHWPEELVRLFSGSLWPERLFSVRVATDRWGSVELHSAHVPPATARLPKGRRPTKEEEKAAWFKVYVIESIFNHLARPSAHHRILCGDFNAPNGEIDSENIATGCQEVVETNMNGGLQRRVQFVGRVRKAGDQRGFSPDLWVGCELRVLRGLEAFGLYDVFRLLHGYGDVGVPDFSYYTSKAHRSPKNRRRYDHVFASRSLNVEACEYLIDVLENRLSDHAPLMVTFNPAVVT